MIRGLIEHCVRRPVATVLLAVLACGAGAAAMSRVPIDALPDLSEHQVIVFADWPGRSPQEIEDQVTRPLSVALQGLAGVRDVRSSSDFGFSMASVIFEDGTDFYFARERVTERLSTAAQRLPAGVLPYMAPDATALGQVLWYTIDGSDHDLGQLREIQDWYVRDQLASVAGVAEVAAVGGAPVEWQVDVDPHRLRQYSVSLGDVMRGVSASSSAMGAGVVHRGGTEYVVRGVGWVETVDQLEATVVASRGPAPIRVRDVARVSLGPGFQHSVLEKDGRDAVGGVVVMRHGANPADVIRDVRRKIAELADGLPEGVRVTPFYDRTELIDGAIHTAGWMLVHEILIAFVLVLLVMRHVRASLVICVAVPAAVLLCFGLMWLFDVSANIMSLSGIAVSIGVLVDQAVVMTDSAMHSLRARFGDERVTGDTREIVGAACRRVGRPIAFAVLIMVISFLPVFALGGIEGRLFRPLALTKTFALVAVGVVSVTLLPALLPLALRGRIRHEEDSWAVRTLMGLYRPVLEWLTDRHRLVIGTFLLVLGVGAAAASWLGSEFMPALDEGTVLDMPVSVPRIAIPQAAATLKARNAQLRGFPEVGVVVGKAGRAETPTDPSPLEMIETVVNLRPRDGWPYRHLAEDAALGEFEEVIAWAVQDGLLRAEDSEGLAAEALIETRSRFDRRMRELCIAAQAEWTSAIASELLRGCLTRLAATMGVPVEAAEKLAASADDEPLEAICERLVISVELPDLRDVSRRLGRVVADGRQAGRAALVSELEDLREDLIDLRDDAWVRRNDELRWRLDAQAAGMFASLALDVVAEEAERRGVLVRSPTDEDRRGVARSRSGTSRPVLRRKSKQDLIEELDRDLRMLGWANIWTQPIVNRVDMLATGIRTEVGVKVFGPDRATIHRTAVDVAGVLARVPGAADVFPEQTMGKLYIDVDVDRERAARFGMNVADVLETVATAVGGRATAQAIQGRVRRSIRVRYIRDARTSVEEIERVLVATRTTPVGGTQHPDPMQPPSGDDDDKSQRRTAHAHHGGGAGGASSSSGGAMGSMADDHASGPAGVQHVELREIAAVQVVEGPPVIRTENGQLRSYVQLNVRGRDVVGFVDDARRAVDEQVVLPESVHLEWGGQFQHRCAPGRR